jgi:hypothetical protein
MNEALTKITSTVVAKGKWDSKPVTSYNTFDHSRPITQKRSRARQQNHRDPGLPYG